MPNETDSRFSFTAHPASVGESYVEHMGVAFSFGGRMLAAGLACLVHGIFPFLFTKTGSKTVTELHERMVRNRVRHAHREGAEGVVQR
ncbi:DUF6356 family protein [Salinarimonas ramus]|uniref:Capsule biosynthesis protein n=1 Tax=Salinarimonas ramus TaxID=690164 RepID=A0A917Q8G4_9HYPH|nr:DUF6356 family protein [Salinarimonas ramus]GGK35310.1 hypothetical protein GCM10011322_22680 [Salinarimonas ramus]